MKALDWPQDYSYVDFFRHSRADNAVVSGVIWEKFVLIQAFMHALVTCMNEEGTIKNEDASAITTVLSLHD